MPPPPPDDTLRDVALLRAAAEYRGLPVKDPDTQALALFLARMAALWVSLPAGGDRAVLLRAGLVDYLTKDSSAGLPADPGSGTVRQIVDAMLDIIPELSYLVTHNYGDLHVEIKDRVVYEVEATQSRRPHRRAG